MPSIPFDENTAERLKEQFKLAPGTIRVWRHRDKIPARYMDSNYEQLEAATVAQRKKIAGFVGLKYINRAGFEGVAAYRLGDLLRETKHTRLRKEEAQKILLQVRTLQKKAAQLLHNNNRDDLQAFMKMPILKPLVWLGNYKLYNRLRQGLQTITEKDWDYIRERLKMIAEPVN